MGNESRPRPFLHSALLLGALVLTGVGLVAWKAAAAEGAAAAASNMPEPAEVVTAAPAEIRDHRGATTAIGTVLATRSVTLRNELPGTVRRVALAPGAVVEPGTVLVALDVAVEEAELRAQEARVGLAETTLARLERMVEQQAASVMELDRARAEREVALADVERIRAVIERKTIRAPFRARVGLADLHPGQFLEAGTLLTTLQGVEGAVHLDFSVAQGVGAALAVGDPVEVELPGGARSVTARIVAVDARVDPSSRNTAVRARIEGEAEVPAPGASLRVRVPVGVSQPAVVVPVAALRKGPEGDHVFLLRSQPDGSVRAEQRSVRAGPILDDRVVILQGVEPGDPVAASGSFKLREGALVQVAGGAGAEGTP